MDPQFMSNLSKLGQVSIHDAGRFVPNVSSLFPLTHILRFKFHHNVKVYYQANMNSP